MLQTTSNNTVNLNRILLERRRREESPPCGVAVIAALKIHKRALSVFIAWANISLASMARHHDAVLTVHVHSTFHDVADVITPLVLELQSEPFAASSPASWREEAVKKHTHLCVELSCDVSTKFA